jgi:L-2-hydroxyglutarate oxidase LhgO
MGASRVSVAVIGAGIVGLATAYRLIERRPDLRVTVLDKEAVVGQHQTGHNSGVIHRGIYYRPGSLKADLCVRGAADMEAFCATHDIPVQRCGKLIVALESNEIAGLSELHARGTANGVPDLELVGPERLMEIEPHAVGLCGLHSPSTSIVDFRQVTEALRDELLARGVEMSLGRELQAIEERSSELVLRTSAGDMQADRLVACAGLQSDRVAKAGGVERPDGVRIVPFRGDYFLLRPERADLCRGLIYPVPDPALPFLGVHLTHRVDGSVWLGPNAVLAFAREGYRPGTISITDLGALVGFPGFWRMGLRYWRTGVGEVWRTSRRSSFLAALRRYVPEMTADDLLPGPAGVRAQAVAADGTLVDDFVFAESARQLHVLNAPSPAATSSLAIGSVIADRVLARFDRAL